MISELVTTTGEAIELEGGCEHVQIITILGNKEIQGDKNHILRQL